MHYQAPVNELRFALHVHGKLPEILALPASDGLDADTVDAVLEEAARFAEQVLAPTNRTGDLHGAKLAGGKVETHPDLVNAYQEYSSAGWVGLRAPAEYDGQGLPALVSAACEEIWCASNLSFSLMPMLTLGAIEALLLHGSDEQKQTYLPPMSRGEWSGTMNLTEPNAGTDLGQVATKAVPKENGAYALSGQKVFITWGEQEITENIVHLVLARLPDAAPGVQGISLFIVPKYLVNADGSLGERNGVSVTGLEHKLGIHASPTCTMQFEEAEGYLVGRAGKGLAYMFTMMKHARLGVGIEGHAVAERAYQNALAYAKERVQSRELGSENHDPVTIIHHPDVRRMLLVQKATLSAQRALYMQAAAAIDLVHGLEDPVARKQAELTLDYLIPIVKAWCTDNGVLLTNLSMQVYGGMGYVEETGISQYVRDVRITPIYEGTNGVQALDLIGRKTAANGGAVPLAMLEEGKTVAAQLAAAEPALAEPLLQAIALAKQSIADIVAQMHEQPALAAAASNAYLQQMGCTLGAIAEARAYLAAAAALDGETDAPLGDDFYKAQQHTAKVFFAYVLPQVHTFAEQVHSGGEALLAMPFEAY